MDFPAWLGYRKEKLMKNNNNKNEYLAGNRTRDLLGYRLVF